MELNDPNTASEWELQGLRRCTKGTNGEMGGIRIRCLVLGEGAGEGGGGGERGVSECTLNCPSWSATTTWPLMAFATTALLFFLSVPEPTRDVRSPACAQ